MINAEDIKLGSCWIFYDNEDLGSTFNDSIVISSEMEVHDVQPDQSGTPVKSIVTGNPITIDMEIGEITRKRLADLIGGAELVDGDLNLADAVGTDLRATGKSLMLIPVDPLDNDIYYFPLAGCITNLKLAFARTTERTLPIKFKGYPDPNYWVHPTYGTGAVMAIIDRPAKGLSYSISAFNEAVANDGTIDNTTPMLIDIDGIGSFTGSVDDDYVVDGKVVVTQLSDGLTAVIKVVHARQLSVTITGTSIAHEVIDNIVDLTFTFQDTAFEVGDATLFVGYDKSDITVSYLDA